MVRGRPFLKPAGASALCGCLLLAGCEPTQRVVRDDWATWTQAMRAGGADIAVGGRAEPGDALSAALHDRRNAGFAVRLGTYEGADRGARASRDTVWAKIQGIPQVWSVEAEGLISVYAGRYSRSDDPSAGRLVEQVRAMERAEDDAPFQDARVVQLTGVEVFATNHPNDLRTYSGQYGYSVQIGFFDVQFEGDRRAAAEAWVQQLRDEHDELAFYYHGPHRSMVTLGLFTRRDFVKQGTIQTGFVDKPGPEIQALLEKYPHNIGNGMTLRQKDSNGRDIGTAPSFLVRIP